MDLPLTGAAPKPQKATGAFSVLRRVLNRRAAAVGVAGALAVLLAVTGGPRLLAQASLLPVRGALERLQEGLPESGATLDEVEHALRTASRFDPGDGRIWTDLGLVGLLQLDALGASTPSGRAVLARALQDLERGLARDPVNSFAWARLAGARLIAAGEADEGTLAALRLSYLTGPYVDKIMPFRADIALRSWERLSPELQAFASQELVYLWERRGDWRENQVPLMALLCRTNRVALLSRALSEAHRSLAEFDKLYPLYMSPEGCAGANR